jgi:hypothetical protein
MALAVPVIVIRGRLSEALEVLSDGRHKDGIPALRFKITISFNPELVPWSYLGLCSKKKLQGDISGKRIGLYAK